MCGNWLLQSNFTNTLCEIREGQPFNPPRLASPHGELQKKISNINLVEMAVKNRSLYGIILIGSTKINENQWINENQQICENQWICEARRVGGYNMLCVQAYLIRCVDQLFLESQLPHKIVNLLVTVSNLNNKLTVCGGVDFLKLIDKYIMWDKLAVCTSCAIALAGQISHGNRFNSNCLSAIVWVGFMLR